VNHKHPDPSRPYLELNIEAHLPRENDDLALNVGAAEVVPGVGLGEALVLGVLNHRGEGHAGLVGVEDVAERAAEDALDFEGLVAGGKEVRLEGACEVVMR